MSDIAMFKINFHSSGKILYITKVNKNSKIYEAAIAQKYVL